MFYKKYCDPSACCKCRDCSTMKTEKECLSRSGGGSRFYSSGYICLESSKNFIGIIEAVARRCSRGKGVLRNFEKFLRTPPVAASRINS